MRPVCIHCKFFFRILKNGVFFEEGMPVGDHPFTVVEPDALTSDTKINKHSRSPTIRCIVCRQLRNAHWGPYKLWIGDQYECPGCHTQIIIGVPNNPFSEHFMPDYTEQVKEHAPLLRVNDC